MRAIDVMTKDVVTATPEMTVQDVAKLMINHRISGIPIVEGDRQLVGIVSEGDLLRRSETGTERQHSHWSEWFSPNSRLAAEYVKTHAKRVADIMSDQTRALRVRSFANFLQRNPKNGAYFQIGAHAEEKLRTYSRHNPAAADVLLRDSWASADDVARAAAYRTTLRRMSGPDFDLLARHGYETAKWNIRLFC